MFTLACAVFPELLRHRLRGIAELSHSQVEALEAHYTLLLRWNRVLNLTSIREISLVVERHYCESIFLATHLPSQRLRIADVGSGAGFPGLPVAIYRPDCHVTLVESHQRKAVFLKEAVRSLPNVNVLACRAQDVSGEFDCALSRAVSYRELASSLKGLARAVDLLTGAEKPPSDMGFEWENPISLPWGNQRYLVVGKRN